MKWKEPYIRWIGILAFGLIAYFVLDKQEENIPFWVCYLKSVSLAAVYWNGAYFILFFFRRQFPDIKQTSIRLMLSAMAIMVWMAIGGIPLKLLFGDYTLSEVPAAIIKAGTTPFTFISGAFVSIAYEAFYFFEKWKEAFRQNEALKNQQIKTQYEVLQNQMSPHFLFNSLNTLAAIIPDDPKAAVSFAESLSDVYRYILKNKERELVKLGVELTFVKSYAHLLRMRYPHNLLINFDIEDHHMDRAIPPLTLQMLIENAIKHNIVSRSKPLIVDIYVEKGMSLIVKNNLQPKKSMGKSTKTGLDNIRKRYQYLGAKDIDVITSASNFMVALPLINLVEEKDLHLV